MAIGEGGQVGGFGEVNIRLKISDPGLANDSPPTAPAEVGRWLVSRCISTDALGGLACTRSLQQTGERVHMMELCGRA